MNIVLEKANNALVSVKSALACKHGKAEDNTRQYQQGAEQAHDLNSQVRHML